MWRPHSLHTAEATGSIPVTPTSTTPPRLRRSGRFARRFARRSRTWGVFKAVQPGWVRAAVRVNGQLRLVVSRLVQLASLEHPISPVKFGWGDRLGDLEGEGQSLVECLDNSGGHLRGGVPVAGADAAATLPLPQWRLRSSSISSSMTRAGMPSSSSQVEKLCRRSWGPPSRRCARSFSGAVGCVLVEAAKVVPRQGRPCASRHPVPAAWTGKDQSVAVSFEQQLAANRLDDQRSQ